MYTDTATGARSAVSDTLTAAHASYSYDQADRLIGFNGGFGPYSYGYDGDGLRQSKALSGTVEAYTWDTAEGLPQLLQDSGTRHVLGPDGLPLEQVSVTGTVLYYYQDQLGSTRALLTGAAQAAGAYAYNAFGTVAYKTGSANNPFGYAGQYTDPETGFEYLQARYYDPATSQFLTRDPLVDVTGQPYAYVGDDPLNAADPSGLCPPNGFCPWETVGNAVHAGYDCATATGGAFAHTIAAGAVGTYNTVVEAAKLIPPTGIVLDGGLHNYEMYALTDLSQAAYTADHIDVAGQLIARSVAAPFQEAIACPSATTIGTATGDTLGNLALLFGVAKTAGFVGEFGGIRGLTAVGARGAINLARKGVVNARTVLDSRLGIGPGAGGYTNIASEASTRHILYGDATGGGHVWPGLPGKTPYPISWTPAKIMHVASEVTTDPATVWTNQTGPAGAWLTNAKNPARWVTWVTRDGIRIRVVYEPHTSRIVTAYKDP